MSLPKQLKLFIELNILLMKNFLLFILIFFCSTSMFGQLCMQTFTASGQDDDPTVLTIASADITCNMGNMITGITLCNPAGNLTNSFCGNWYDFTLAIDGVDQVTGCAADLDGIVIPPSFSTVTITSADLDVFSDGVTITIDMCVSFMAACTPPAGVAAINLAMCPTDFEVDVNVSALGDGAPFISDGVSNWPVTAVGVTTVGPFPVGSSATLTLHHGSDAVCDVPLGTFTLSSCPPPNDDCVDAIPLTVDAMNCDGTITNGDNTGATAGADPLGSCFSGGVNGVWYSFMAPASGNVIVTTDFTGGTSGDTEIAVYDDCAGTTELGCDQDGGSVVNFNSVIDPLVGLTPGVTYYIVVSGWNGTEGSFCIEVNEIPACLSPSGLAVANITDSSADVSWTTDPAHTDVTVEVCPSGVLPGDASCIAVSGAVSPETVSGLDPCTDYDAHIFVLCGDENPGLVNPVAFSSDGPVELMPACGSTVTYPPCPGATYNSGENITWTLCATPGMVAEIEFTYVDLETSGSGDLCWDELLITYSDGSAEPVQCGEPDGDGGVGSGLAPGSVFTDPVPGGCMTVTFTSDGSVTETGFSFDFNCVEPCSGTNNVVLVASATTVVAPPSMTCDDPNGYTYYEDPANPGTFVFAINWGTMNAAAKAAATVTVTQAGAMGYTEGGAPGVSGDATWTMERYWDVDLGGASLAAPVDARFYYDPAEKAAVDAAVMGDGRSIVIQDWFKTVTGAYSGTPMAGGPDPGNELLLTGATTGVENGVDYVEFAGVASFSGGTFAGSVSEALPIDLVSIKGTAMPDHNRIDWETATEINNDYQAIERSVDGRNNWTEIARVSGRNTQQLQAYTVQDDQPLKESYYRLRSVDLNGATQISEVISVNRTSFNSVRSMISPNPFADVLQVRLESDSDQMATISVFSLEGKILHQTRVQLRNSVVHNESMQLEELQTGIYLLQINMGDYNETRRIVKVQ